MSELAFTATLFVPGDRTDRFEKALRSGADAVIYDLEDAVAADGKAAARQQVAAALNAGLIACVRINSPRADEGRRDLEMLARAARPTALVIPKAQSPDEVGFARDAMDVAIVAILESVAGIERAREIARSAGVVAVAFGSHDLCAQLGATTTPEVTATFRALIVLAARGAGVQAIDSPFLAIDDDDGLRADARRARDFGFDGKLAIHPKHVAPIHEAFAPSREELARAQRILAASRRGGVTVVDGFMVDGPVVAAAQRTIARASLHRGGGPQ